MSSEGVFWTPSDRISHHIHIVRTSFSWLPARSGIFCLLVEVVYWTSGLKFVPPMINLAFLGIIVKVRLPVKFCLHSFEWFCLQISSEAKYFFLLSKAWCLLVVILNYFQIWNKKEHSIIISRIISRHMGLMYIETPCIYQQQVLCRNSTK